MGSLNKFFGERLAQLLHETLIKQSDQDKQITSLLSQLENLQKTHFSSLKDTNILCSELIHVTDVMNRNSE